MRYIASLPMIMRLHLARIFTWRGEVLTWIIFDPLILIAFPLIWITIAREQGGTLAGWTTTEIATYYLLYGIGMQILMSHPMVHLGNLITKERLGPYLVRPFPYFYVSVTEEIAWKIIRGIFVAVPIFILIVLFRSYFVWPSGSIMLLVLPLVVAGFLIQFLSSYLAGLISFWTENYQGTNTLFWVLQGIAGGMYAPVEFFPQAIQSIIKALPFWSVLQFPLNVLVGRIEIGSYAFFDGFFRQLFWLSLLLITVWFVWRRGLRRYTSAGQ